MSSATRRTAARRCRVLSVPLRAGSSRLFTTRSMAPLSCSVGGPAHPGEASESRRAPPSITRIACLLAAPRRPFIPGALLDLPEDVFGQEFLEIDRGFDLLDAAVGRDRLLRPA